MGFRSLVLVSIVAAVCSLAPSARADVPPADGGDNQNCTIAEEMIAGTTCAMCNPSGSGCTNLGNTYSYVCTYSATEQVWCNGPIRDTPSDQNVASCSVAVPGGAWSGAAACAVAAAIALATRRRRRS